jgi:hypothetical protein
MAVPDQIKDPSSHITMKINDPVHAPDKNRRCQEDEAESGCNGRYSRSTMAGYRSVSPSQPCAADRAETV